MKTFTANCPKHHRQNGSAVLVLITLLIIMVMLAVANSKALFHLRREIKWLEHEQVEQLNASQTNVIVAAEGSLKPESK